MGATADWMGIAARRFPAAAKSKKQALARAALR